MERSQNEMKAKNAASAMEMFFTYNDRSTDWELKVAVSVRDGKTRITYSPKSDEGIAVFFVRDYLKGDCNLPTESILDVSARYREELRNFKYPPLFLVTDDKSSEAA